MLQNEKFAEWAGKNVVMVVGHNDPGHDAEVEDAKGKKAPGCPLYTGLQCKEHQDIMNQVGNPGEGLPKIELPNGVPNSWLVTPDGTVTQVPAAEQQVVAKIEELVGDIEKKGGKPMSFEDYEKIHEAFDTGAKAVESGDFKAALTAYGVVDKKTAKNEALAKHLKEVVETLNTKVVAAFETVKAEEDAAQRDKDMKALRAKIAAKVGANSLPVLADVDAWLKANPAPAPATK